MRILVTVLKMSLAGLLTSLIAKALNLDYWITAGILAVLSTQLTKKDSFNIATKRILDMILGLFLASLMFVLFGYNFWVFSVFLLIFALLSFALEIEVGLVPVLVLVSHLLEYGSFSWGSLLNEFAIMTIAIVVVLTLDLVYPSPTEKMFKEYIDQIDNQLKEHMKVITMFLKGIETKEATLKHYEKSLEVFEETYEEAILLDKDLLFQKKNEYLSYLRMRHVQMTQINHIYQHALKFVSEHKHTKQIVDFIEELITDIGYYDKATSQMEKLEEVRDYYKTTDLPKTRQEFETRAMLYQILNELEYFLDAKIIFHLQNPRFGF